MQFSDASVLVLIMGFFAPWSQLKCFFAYSKETMPKKCRLPPKKGWCQLSLENFYYDFKNSMCKTFIYGGCGGNSNNFPNLFDCVYECERFELLASWSSLVGDMKWRKDPPQQCTYRRRVGRCKAKLQRYYYDTWNKRCIPFVYGGCGGNKNNFKSYRDCAMKCEQLGKPERWVNPEVKRVSMLDTCEQPLDTGPCQEKFPRFYYDASNKTCKSFTFGGCNGNRNNFVTKQECLRECVSSGSP